ncbi:MAG: glutamine-hydrolyzing carbamoyl-phosphate synthase small subunit [Candidatus Methanosuratincola sp.]|jgi:carbamoyl-phosphate synthase small subunit
MEAILVLEDGSTFHGKGFGAEGEATGEVVFNTSITGYQEILTDPSYCGQIVVMTYPEIGNYGVNALDEESRKPFVRGFVVREYWGSPSNWRSSGNLGDYLKSHGIVGIEGVDTRSITRITRNLGAMRGIISTVDFDKESLLRKVRASRGMLGTDLVSEVTTEGIYTWSRDTGEWGSKEGVGEKGRFSVVVYDFGTKYNILRRLADMGCDVTVVPANTSPAEVLGLHPDGIVLSNGPGDPAAVTYAVETTRALVGKTPILGICLGHQILSLALGGKTFKLKFGHRGANQPVKNLLTGRVEITSQNHGFAVDADSLGGDVEITHINLNDGTVEGIRHRELPAFSVQYHPEASPGPHDSSYLFLHFAKLMEEWRTRG